MRSALCRTCLLLLALSLASSPVFAAEAQSGFFASLWRIVMGSANETRGSIMDPDGLTAAACSDRGSGMDPDGCPASQATGSGSDLGSGMDPNG